MAAVNRQITLAARPVGFPKVSDFQLVYRPLPSPAEGEVLARAISFSLDPYVRARMNEAGANGRSIAIGGVMVGEAVASVMESRDPRFVPGDIVVAMLGWQEFAVAQGRELRKIDPALAPVSTALGVLGTPGLTAYFGMLHVCDPQPGETVVVSGAAGGVGMVAGQIAKIKVCRVVGVAGTDARVSWLVDELGFDAAIKCNETDIDCEELEKLCPDGIDVYFDNVGGVVTDAVLRLINVRARVAVCGQSSQYNLEEPEHGPRWLGQVMDQEAKVQGFLTPAFAKAFPEGLAQLAEWLKQGKLKYREEVAQGIESAPQAFIAMLQGRNQGKQLVELSPL